ncbi:hypothetical protein K505DRAFT_378495, partial [Melanomma pulvis-pyrius CBS 109.77]
MMKPCPIIRLFSLFSLLFSPAFSQAFRLNPDSTFTNVWSPDCDGCAPLSKLRATAFGVEIAPDYISLAMKHANRTLVPMLKIDPGSRFRALAVAWMRVSVREVSLVLSPGLDVVMQRRRETEIIRDGLLKLLYEAEKRYPGLGLEYGGIAMPDFIYRNDVFKHIVEEAINSTGLRNPKYADRFLLYPSDFAVAATTVDAVSGHHSDALNIDTLIFDALVVTNTSSYLSASWYQFSMMQYSIGQTIVPKVDAPYLTRPYTYTAHRPGAQYGKPPGPTHIDARPNLARIKTFVQEREALYAQRKGAGRRFMTGKSRLILRLDTPSDAAIHAFAKELNRILKGSRFDPASTDTTVYREEHPDGAVWAPALYVSSDMRSRVDAGLPLGCTVDHAVCAELKACVRHEARGDLVLCEDATPPQATPLERIERGVRAGSWAFWRAHLFAWTEPVLDNLEARLWLLYCADGRAWSGPASRSRCADAVVRVAGGGLGVWEEYVGLANSVVYAVARYWIDGGPLAALLSVPVFWIGRGRLLTVAVWAVSKVLGRGLYADLVEAAGDL